MTHQCINRQVNRLFAAGLRGAELGAGCRMVRDWARQGVDPDTGAYLADALIAAQGGRVCRAAA